MATNRTASRQIKQQPARYSRAVLSVDLGGTRSLGLVDARRVRRRHQRVFGLSNALPLLTGMALVVVLSVVLWVSMERTDVLLPWLVLVVLASSFTATQIRMTMVPDHLLPHAVWALVIGTVLSIEERPAKPRILLGDVSLEFWATHGEFPGPGSV